MNAAAATAVRTPSPRVPDEALRPIEVTLAPVERADVVVVGAGPGGAAAAAHLARRGRDVILIDKETFPRDKVCGDGLTPRVVRELLDLGLVDEATGRADGWATQKGLRIHGGHTVMELPWPELDDWPSWGATASRQTGPVTPVRCASRAPDAAAVRAIVASNTRRDAVAPQAGQSSSSGHGSSITVCPPWMRSPFCVAQPSARPVASSTSPRSSSSRTTRGVSPSPHTLSRGTVSLSIRITSRPRRARCAAAAAPPGPAPTTTTSARSTGPRVTSSGRNASSGTRADGVRTAVAEAAFMP